MSLALKTISLLQQERLIILKVYKKFQSEPISESIAKHDFDS
jgi:hypothetical protein